VSKSPNAEVTAARARANIWYNPVKCSFFQIILIFASILAMFLLLKLPCQVIWKGENSSRPELLALPVKSLSLVYCIFADAEI